jgi:hypothetical protein
MICEEGKPMLKLVTLVFASALLLASGCAEHDQMVALQQSCSNGNQNACQQIAQNQGPENYPAYPNVRVFPSGQTPAPANFGSFSGLSGIGGMGAIR